MKELLISLHRYFFNDGKKRTFIYNESPQSELLMSKLIIKRNAP